MDNPNDEKQTQDRKGKEEKTQYGEVNAAQPPGEIQGPEVSPKRKPKERKSSKEKTEYKDSPSVRKKRSKLRRDRFQSAEKTCIQTEGVIMSSRRKKKSKAEKTDDATQDETPKRKKLSRGALDRTQAPDESPRRRRSRKREITSMEQTAVGGPVENVVAKTFVDEDNRKEKGKLMVAEMRSRRSRNASARKKKTKGMTEASVMHAPPPAPTVTAEADQKPSVPPPPAATTNGLQKTKEEKDVVPASTMLKPKPPPTNGTEPPKEEKSVRQISIRARPSKPSTNGAEPPKEEKSVRQTSIRIRWSRTTTTTTTTRVEGPKEERSIRQTSIRERLRRGLKSALSAFSRASLEKSFQNAKAKMMAPKRTGSLYAFQDTYMGGVMDDEEDTDEDDDVDFYSDMSHRPDLILVDNNNTNDGQIFNEKGQPFWKDKKYLAEVPKPTRKPLSSLLLMLSEKKLTLKDSLATPGYLNGMELELEEMQCRDRKYFNDDLLLSNTIRSIISTLDDIDEYAKNKPVDIHQLPVLEPKTAKEYSRHYPENNEEVPFVYSGLGVCKTKKSKSKSSSLSTNSSSSSTDRSTRSKRKKKKKDQTKTEAKSERSIRRKRSKKKEG